MDLWILVVLVGATTLGLATQSKWWRRRLRQADMTALWPSFVDQAPSLDHAKAGFFYHIENDRAWTTDFTFQERVAFVDTLTPESRRAP